MKRSDSGSPKRRKTLRFAVLGLFLGAGLAYALVAWRRALMPEFQLLHTDEEISIYEVHGEDFSREYTRPLSEIQNSGAPAEEGRAE